MGRLTGSVAMRPRLAPFVGVAAPPASRLTGSDGAVGLSRGTLWPTTVCVVTNVNRWKRVLLSLAALGSAACGSESVHLIGTEPGAEPGMGGRSGAGGETGGGSDVAGWRLLWAEEFTAAELDTSVWHPYHSTYGDGNNELQCHTPDNLELTGDTLRIVARREQTTCPNGSVRRFSSGFVGTRETGTFFPRYGRFAIRARLPHGQGLWPAFWLRHRDGGASTAEVDVLEYFHSQVPGRSSATVHLDGEVNVSKQTRHFEDPTPTPNWHTWAVEIDPTPEGVRFRFLLDDEPYHAHVEADHLAWTSIGNDDSGWDIAVNLSVGGNWAGDPDEEPLGLLTQLERCAQSGTYPSSCATTGILRAEFPATYEVDWVRVYERE